MLYIRMSITMLVGLYASRVVLSTLGISDYGVYNVVGGMVAMLSFLNTGMTAASQRFISYELGRGSDRKLNRVFSTSVNIHVFIALIILFLAETVGLWFVNTQLNINLERIEAANWVYQFSIMTFMLSVLSVPYNSCIVAHEHIKVFAYIGILEMALKLVVVYLLVLFYFDKLILYAFLTLLVGVFIRICYGIYCSRNFEECKYHFIFDKKLFKEMFSFAGWSMVGSLGFAFKDQGLNIILNLFWGTAVNAARGVALQVSSLITTFSSNFSMALNPQITKQYAAGNAQESLALIYAGSRFTFFLLAIISVPFLINIDYVLKLWLGVVPEYTSIFLKLSLLVSLLYSLSGSVTVGIQATGNIKVFQIGICIMMLFEIPVAYILLRLGFPPYSAFYPGLVTNTIAIFFRFYLLKRMIPKCNFMYYTVHVLFRCLIIFGFSWMICEYIHNFFNETFLTMIVTSIIALCIMSITIWTWGMLGKERKLILAKVKKWLYGEKLY